MRDAEARSGPRRPGDRCRPASQDDPLRRAARLRGGASLVAATDRDPPIADGVTIPYGDLDLRTIEGARLLEQRLVEAASAVCAGLDAPSVPSEAYDRCRADAISGAILMLRRPPSALAVVTS
jgi:UrcA family protein